MTFSIIQKSQLEGADRVDAEYYQQKYLDLSKRLKKLKTTTIGDFCRVSDGDHSKIPGFVESDGVRYLRAKDLQGFFIDNSDPVYVSKPYYERLKRSHIRPLDIVLSIMGTIGNLAVVLPDSSLMTANRAVSIISPKNQDLFSSYFLAVYLESLYGAFQRERESMGGVQERVNLDDLARIKVPIIDKSNQELVTNIFESALKEFKDSMSFYQQAEGILLKELGLKDFQQKNELGHIVNFSEVKNTDRIDAEYFQPKYEELMEKINSKNPKTLESFIKNYSTGFTYKSENYLDEGVPLIRINNIKKGYIDLTDTAFLSKKDSSVSSKDIARSGDVVLSMSGTIGSTSIIPSDIPICNVNQRILKFTPNNIDANYLVLVLNSIIGSFQLERIGTGGVQTNISYKDIKNTVVPDLSGDIQKRISDLVKKSHEARKKSKELLDQAKKEVEEMIEKQAKN